MRIGVCVRCVRVVLSKFTEKFSGSCSEFLSGRGVNGFCQGEDDEHASARS